ncbi:hypothetical protein D3C85_889290 [compost metagenome]
MNLADDATDFLTVDGQLLDHLRGLLHAAGQPGNRLTNPVNHLLAAAGQLLGVF